jgi:hypothetical protein
MSLAFSAMFQTLQILIGCTPRLRRRKAESTFCSQTLGELLPLGTSIEAHFNKMFGTDVKGLLFTGTSSSLSLLNTVA